MLFCRLNRYFLPSINTSIELVGLCAPFSPVKHFFPPSHLPSFLHSEIPTGRRPYGPSGPEAEIPNREPPHPSVLLFPTFPSSHLLIFLVSAAATFITSLLVIASSFFLTFLEKYSCSVLFNGSPRYFFKTSSFCLGANKVLR